MLQILSFLWHLGGIRQSHQDIFFCGCKEQQISMLRRPEAEPLIVQAAIALISILNPHRLLLTGDLLQESDLGRIRTACQRCIPQEYMPDLVFIPSTDRYYLMGMYWTAMDRKENIP